MVAAFNSFKVNLDRDEAENDEEVGDDSGELCTLDEAEDFLDRELDHEVKFSSLNRIACFSHALQLVVNKFGSVDSFKDVMKHTKAIVRKMNTSTKATERLITLSGKKLIKDCPTRWSSTFLLVNRLLDVKDEVKVVLDEQGWNDLAVSEWRMLKNILVLLHPFAKFTSLLRRQVYHPFMCNSGYYGYEYPP